jgi:hypothetical protein
MNEAFERPFRPVELSDTTLTSLPLQEMPQQLMTEEAFQMSGRNALTLTTFCRSLATSFCWRMKEENQRNSALVRQEHSQRISNIEWKQHRTVHF